MMKIHILLVIIIISAISCQQPTLSCFYSKESSPYSFYQIDLENNEIRNTTIDFPYLNVLSILDSNPEYIDVLYDDERTSNFHVGRYFLTNSSFIQYLSLSDMTINEFNFQDNSVTNNFDSLSNKIILGGLDAKSDFSVISWQLNETNTPFDYYVTSRIANAQIGEVSTTIGEANEMFGFFWRTPKEPVLIQTNVQEGTSTLYIFQNQGSLLNNSLTNIYPVYVRGTNGENGQLYLVVGNFLTTQTLLYSVLLSGNQAQAKLIYTVPQSILFQGGESAVLTNDLQNLVFFGLSSNQSVVETAIFNLQSLTATLVQINLNDYDGFEFIDCASSLVAF